MNRSVYYPAQTTFALNPNEDQRPAANSDVVRNVLHELGHVLRFAHPGDPSVLGRSVMTQDGSFNQTVYGFPVWETGRHLFPYDSDCIETRMGVREVEYQWLEWDPTPGIWSSTADSLSAAWYTTRSIVGGGALRRNTSSTETRFPLLRFDPSSPTSALSDSLRAAFVVKDGNIPFGSSTGVVGNSLGRPVGTYRNVQLMSPLEKTWNNGNNARLNYSPMPFSAAYSANPPTANVDSLDPPTTSSSQAPSARVSPPTATRVLPGFFPAATRSAALETSPWSPTSPQAPPGIRSAATPSLRWSTHSANIGWVEWQGLLLRRRGSMPTAVSF